jgi:class 3 adenylate cyclase/tetratricopeptide (TPR) repeat protein
MARIIGLDVHRTFAEMAIYEHGRVRHAGRILTTAAALELFARGLTRRDDVVLEATCNTHAIASLLRAHAGRVVVSNPRQTRIIAEAKIKTDKIDAAVLIQLYASGFLPEVWMPDKGTEALRRQVARRAQIVRHRTRLKNQIHAILHRNLLPRCPASDLFGHKGRAWLATQPLPPDERAAVTSLHHLSVLPWPRSGKGGPRMQCSRCHAENREGRRFCAKCAAPLTTACPSCGFSNEPGEDFCGGCAAPLAAGQPAEARFASPQSYTPKHLAERILTSKSALEGERKQVTVLFADLKGSMELLADRDPEEARKLLDPVLEHMMEAVHRYEGTVNQVMGDGIMALFGAPLAHEDHAVRACYAALDMQGSIRRYAEEVWRSDGVTVKIRVGVNSGEVVVRAIGSDLRVDYSAVGQTTHLAARMEQLATPGTVLLTSDTLRLAEGYITAQPLGPVPVKGLAAPTEVYELTGAGPLRSRLHAAAARGLTRFVGREAELGQLREALARAAQGHGQLVAVVGEPGVGKSRLVWEVTHSHRIHGWLVLQAGSVSYGKATSYLPVISLLKSYVGIEDRDGPRAVREKLTGKLLTLDRTQEGSLPALLSLLDVPTDDPQWQTLDPPQRRRRTLDAVKRLLLRESQVQPLLVVFEDLHWIDSETQALLDALVESLPTARLVLLVNYRPEYQHPWGSRTYYTQLRLDPLEPETAEELLGALLGSHVSLKPLMRLLIQRTDGNPFFLEESVRTLVETAALEGERGAYRLTTALTRIEVPATVQAILAARIDRLMSPDKYLLQVASVVGKDVPSILLQAIADLPGEALQDGLGHLQAAEFLYETNLYPDPEYTFKHALTHEVAYGGMLHERRRELHARIMDAIEARYPDRLAEHVDRLAYHALQAERWDKACGYLHRAGTRAAERSAHRAAVDWLEQSLAALGHLPETRDTLVRGLDVRFDPYIPLFALAEHVHLRRHMEAAEQIATALGDRRRLGMALARLCPALRVTGDTQRSAETGRRALTIAAEIGDQNLEGEARLGLGQTLELLGDHLAAEKVLRRNISPLPPELTVEMAQALPWFASVSRAWLAYSLARLGRFDEGLTFGAEALRLAQTLDNPFWLIVAHCFLGMLHLERGSVVDSIVHFEDALAIGRSWAITDFARLCSAGLAVAYARSDRIEEALALDVAKAWSLSLLLRGEALFLAGQNEEARKAADEILLTSRQRGERGMEGRALHLLAQMAAESNPPDARVAESHHLEALRLATELQMRPLVAHCHLGLGRLYRRTGKREQAEEHLQTATTMYREMDMRFWLEKADAELRGVER